MWTLSAFADEAAEDVDGQIKAIHAGGLKTIDLRNLDGFNISALPLDHAKGVKQKLDKAGISVGMFGSPIGKIDIAEDFSIDVARLEHLGKLADMFGCRRVRVFSYFNAQNRPMHEWTGETLRRLGALKAQAARLKLTLYHENEHLIFGDAIWRVETIARALRDDPKTSPPGSPTTFGTIFDFDNFNQCGIDPWLAWERLRDVTDGFHLKDSDKNCQHTPIGTGAGRAKDILADAIKRGWTGHLANEPHLARSPAIMATGPGGVPNQKLADLSHTDCFLVGVRSGNALLAEIKAPVG